MAKLSKYRCPCAEGCCCENKDAKYDWQLWRNGARFIPINADAYPPEEREAILKAREDNADK